MNKRSRDEYQINQPIDNLLYSFDKWILDDPADSLPADDILGTLCEYSVPRLQRMLCSEGACIAGDGACVLCLENSDAYQQVN